MLTRRFVVTTCLMFLVLSSVPASAQVLLAGNWIPYRTHEDEQDRGPGPDLGDYLGIPINNAARLFAESWDASRLTLQEHQCRVHVAPYIYHGPLNLRIWEEKDPETQQVVAIKNYISTYEQTRTIWMDGRPHPSPYAPHTFMGFSTGRWEGNHLVVTTTHLKQGWLRRNGVPESDQTTMVERFIRHDKYLTHVAIISDPVYLTEPMVRTTDFSIATQDNSAWTWPCEYVEEITGRPKGEVPHYLPGENPYLKEFTDRTKAPAVAAKGGPETIYPEYQEQLKRGAAVSRAEAPRVSQAKNPDTGEIEVLRVQGNVYLIAGGGSQRHRAGRAVRIDHGGLEVWSADGQGAGRDQEGRAVEQAAPVPARTRAPTLTTSAATRPSAKPSAPQIRGRLSTRLADRKPLSKCWRTTTSPAG